MKKETVMKFLQEATDEKGRTDIDQVNPEATKQVAMAYVSGARGLLPLYSKEAVANYYATDETTVSRCIDRSIEYCYLKFDTVRQIINNSADNENRHAIHRGLTSSQKRYRKLVEDRFEHFKKTFDDSENRIKYDAAYKMYVGRSTRKKVEGSYGFSTEELIYICWYARHA